MTRLTTHQSLLNRPSPIREERRDVTHLPNWVLSLPGVKIAVGKLGQQEFQRRLVHMSPAFLPIGLPFIPHRDVWGPMLLSTLAVVVIVGLYGALKIGVKVQRTREENWCSNVFCYAIPIVAMLLLFPGQAELGLLTLQVVALGDGSATLGGLMLGGPKLPWNARKTYAGCCSFVAVSTLGGTYSYWGEAVPAVPIATVLMICFVTALASAIVESVSTGSNDNLRVGITAGTVGYLMTSLLV